jgi:hypothetical protein
VLIAGQEFERLKVRIEQRPCHICGNREFEWGYLDGAYQPGLFTTKFDRRRHLLASRKCLRCGNVQIFADEQATQRVRRIGRIGCWISLLFLILAFLSLYLHVFS